VGCRAGDPRSCGSWHAFPVLSHTCQTPAQTSTAHFKLCSLDCWSYHRRALTRWRPPLGSQKLWLFASLSSAKLYLPDCSTWQGQHQMLLLFVDSAECLSVSDWPTACSSASAGCLFLSGGAEASRQLHQHAAQLMPGRRDMAKACTATRTTLAEGHCGGKKSSTAPSQRHRRCSSGSP